MKYIVLMTAFASLAFCAPFAQAQYVANYVPIGTFQDPDGILEVFLDLNQSVGPVAGTPDTAVKVDIPNQQYFDHHVSAAEHMTLWDATTQTTITDTSASYFSLLVSVDCAHRTIQAGHAVYYNAENQMLADHNFRWDSEPISPNSLGSVIAQKVC